MSTVIRARHDGHGQQPAHPLPVLGGVLKADLHMTCPIERDPA
jgi:hypothetical protein